MTVSNNVCKASFNGSNTAGPFSFGFPFLANAHLVVIKTLSDLSSVILTETTDYSVTGAGLTAGGTVTLVEKLNVGETLDIVRLVPITQTMDLRNQGSVFPESLEEAYDKLTMITQQLHEVLDRTIKLPESVGVLPSAASRSNGLLGFDLSGNVEVKSSSYTVVVESGGGGEATLVLSDASAGPTTVQLPASGEVVVIKIDDTENAVTVMPEAGSTVCRESTIDLTIQDEPVHLKFYGTNWYRI